MQTMIIFALVGFSLFTWTLGFAVLPLRGRVPMQYTFRGNPTWSLPVWAAFPLVTVLTMGWSWLVIKNGDGNASLSVPFLIQGGALFSVHVFLFLSGLAHKNRILRNSEETSPPSDLEPTVPDTPDTPSS